MKKIKMEDIKYELKYEDRLHIQETIREIKFVNEFVSRISKHNFTILPNVRQPFLLNIIGIGDLYTINNFSNELLNKIESIYNSLQIIYGKFNTITQEKGHLSEVISKYDLLSFEKEYSKLQSEYKEYNWIKDYNFQEFICDMIYSGYYCDIFLRELNIQKESIK